MSESFSRKRPSFIQFRDWFMEEVNKQNQGKSVNPLAHWHTVGDEETRKNIVESFMQKLEDKYGFRPVMKEKLHALDCPVESVANRIFHVFSTMYLVDHINAKMYGQYQKKLN